MNEVPPVLYLILLDPRFRGYEEFVRACHKHMYLFCRKVSY